MSFLTPAQLERARKGGPDRGAVIREVRDANVGMALIDAVAVVDAQLKDPDQCPPHLQAMLDSVAAVMETRWPFAPSGFERHEAIEAAKNALLARYAVGYPWLDPTP